MPRLRTASLFVGVALLFAGCATSSETEPSGRQSPPAAAAPAGCEGSSPTTEISAAKSLFDKSCVQAPAGEPFKLTFRNDDSYQHNFAVTKGKGGEKLYASPFFDGMVQSVAEVPPLDAGSYYFECNIHPFVMNGEYVVS